MCFLMPEICITKYITTEEKWGKILCVMPCDPISKCGEIQPTVAESYKTESLDSQPVLAAV